MKSVGEVMAIGRTFAESLQKSLRGLEIDRSGLVPIAENINDVEHSTLLAKVGQSTPDRIWHVADAMRAGISCEEINQYSKIDPWFLAEMQQIIDLEKSLENVQLSSLNKDNWYQLKRHGFSDEYLATLLNVQEDIVRDARKALGVTPVYKRIDTCSGEFSSDTAYMYSCYEPYCEAKPTNNYNKIIILGGGPNRIGQGIEFDYCCVHAALALRESGVENNND